MTASEESDPDLAFAEVLIRWQQDLAAGRQPASLGDSEESASQVECRASGVVSCLKMLEFARQSRWQPTSDYAGPTGEPGFPSDHPLAEVFGAHRASEARQSEESGGDSRPLEGP